MDSTILARRVDGPGVMGPPSAIVTGIPRSLMAVLGQSGEQDCGAASWEEYFSR